MFATNPHSTETQMLIRKPAEEVYNAFVDPAVTTKFWFTKSTGRLELNKAVEWTWEMYGASAGVVAKYMEPGKRLVFEWGEPARTVNIDFSAQPDSTTYVVITESGYTETGDELIRVIKDSTGGFTTVLDAMKAWLEHGLMLNLVGDKFLK
ncbi:SRPBCC family protein [Pollutibacter soli]|uniref:SRPBCC family protein n=1 Tax=Pollutibacter soli TaxID=3034157 RepID=UPI00301338C6